MLASLTLIANLGINVIALAIGMLIAHSLDRMPTKPTFKTIVLEFKLLGVSGVYTFLGRDNHARPNLGRHFELPDHHAKPVVIQPPLARLNSLACVVKVD